MSDEDLIAMLAGCAAKRPHSTHNNFAQLLSECINSVAQEAKYSSGSETLPEADAASEVRLEAGGSAAAVEAVGSHNRGG